MIQRQRQSLFAVALAWFYWSCLSSAATFANAHVFVSERRQQQLLVVSSSSRTSFLTSIHNNNKKRRANALVVDDDDVDDDFESGSSTSISSSSGSGSLGAVLSLRGGVTAEVSDIVVSAYDWCINLGAPSALVAGAVIATIYETMGSGSLEVRTKDTRGTAFFKRLVRVLLVSSFALELMAIFTSMVCGTMLLSRTLDYMDELVPVQAETTPLAFLRGNFEFEYLTARISFLQGLLNWLASLALCHLIPDSISGVARNMNKMIGYSLLCVICWMIAFYNNHMTFYDNYWGMLQHWFQVIGERFIFVNPPRPMMYVTAPLALLAMYHGLSAFFFNGDAALALPNQLHLHDDEDEDENQPPNSLQY